MAAMPPSSISQGKKNQLKTIQDLNQYLVELQNPNLSAVRKRAIKREAVTIQDLMNYSDLIADTESVEWKEMDRLVGLVLEQTNG